MGRRLMAWISSTVTSWAVPKVPLGSAVGLAWPVPVQLMFQVMVAVSLYGPLLPEARG